MSNIEQDNEELALLNAQIDKIKSQIAERDAHKQEAMNVQPKTRVGWASYIIDNDRGLLDKYADAERAWQTARQQSMYSKELANAQMKEQREYNVNTARDTLAKLQIMKDNAVQQGHDTRDIDVQIASIYRDYPELSVKEHKAAKYDPRDSVEYVLADIEDIDDNNTQEEIKAAIDRINKYNTPNSIRALNKLDKTLAKRIKKEESQEKYNTEVQAWIKGGATTKYLYNLGMETQFAGGKERLVNKKTGKVIAERARTGSASPKPAKSSWEL